MTIEEPTKYLIGPESKPMIDTTDTSRLRMRKDSQIRDLVTQLDQKQQRQLRAPTCSQLSRTVHQGTRPPKQAKGRLIYPTLERPQPKQGRSLTMIPCLGAGLKR